MCILWGIMRISQLFFRIIRKFYNYILFISKNMIFSGGETVTVIMQG